MTQQLQNTINSLRVDNTYSIDTQGKRIYFQRPSRWQDNLYITYTEKVDREDQQPELWDEDTNDAPVLLGRRELGALKSHLRQELQEWFVPR